MLCLGLTVGVTSLIIFEGDYSGSNFKFTFFQDRPDRPRGQHGPGHVHLRPRGGRGDSQRPGQDPAPERAAGAGLAGGAGGEYIIQARHLIGGIFDPML